VRCIFCKLDSGGSRSVEHIVPESLGNKHHVLPPGVVCDKCNNYFARKVEKPFLDSPAVRSLRFHQAVPSKANRIPEMEAVVAPDVPTILRHAQEGERFHHMAVTSAGFRQILANDAAGRDTRIMFPPSGPPDGPSSAASWQSVDWKLSLELGCRSTAGAIKYRGPSLMPFGATPERVFHAIGLTMNGVS